MKVEIEKIESAAKIYFEAKYPLLDLSNDQDKAEIDWWDMLLFVQHLILNNTMQELIN